MAESQRPNDLSAKQDKAPSFMTADGRPVLGVILFKQTNKENNLGDEEIKSEKLNAPKDLKNDDILKELKHWKCQPKSDRASKNDRGDLKLKDITLSEQRRYCINSEMCSTNFSDESSYNSDEETLSSDEILQLPSVLELNRAIGVSEKPCRSANIQFNLAGLESEQASVGKPGITSQACRNLSSILQPHSIPSSGFKPIVNAENCTIGNENHVVLKPKSVVATGVGNPYAMPRVSTCNVNNSNNDASSYSESTMQMPVTQSLLNTAPNCSVTGTSRSKTFITTTPTFSTTPVAATSVIKTEPLVTPAPSIVSQKEPKKPFSVPVILKSQLNAKMKSQQQVTLPMDEAVLHARKLPDSTRSTPPFTKVTFISGNHAQPGPLTFLNKDGKVISFANAKLVRINQKECSAMPRSSAVIQTETSEVPPVTGMDRPLQINTFNNNLSTNQGVNFSQPGQVESAKSNSQPVTDANPNLKNFPNLPVQLLWNLGTSVNQPTRTGNDLKSSQSVNLTKPNITAVLNQSLKIIATSSNQTVVQNQPVDAALLTGTPADGTNRALTKPLTLAANGNFGVTNPLKTKTACSPLTVDQPVKFSSSDIVTSDGVMLSQPLKSSTISDFKSKAQGNTLNPAISQTSQAQPLKVSLNTTNNLVTSQPAASVTTILPTNPPFTLSQNATSNNQPSTIESGTIQGQPVKLSVNATTNNQGAANQATIQGLPIMPSLVATNTILVAANQPTTTISTSIQRQPVKLNVDATNSTQVAASQPFTTTSANQTITPVTTNLAVTLSQPLRLNTPNNLGITSQPALPAGRLLTVNRQVLDSLMSMKSSTNATTKTLVIPVNTVAGPQTSHRIVYATGNHPTVALASPASPNPREKVAIPGTSSFYSTPGSGTTNRHGNVKRPMNAFMVWARHYRPLLAATMNNASNAEISTRLGQVWRDIPESEKTKYYEEAEKIKIMHKLAYPEWTYRPKPKKKRINYKHTPSPPPDATACAINKPSTPLKEIQGTGDSSPTDKEKQTPALMLEESPLPEIRNFNPSIAIRAESPDMLSQDEASIARESEVAAYNLALALNEEAPAPALAPLPCKPSSPSKKGRPKGRKRKAELTETPTENTVVKNMYEKVEEPAITRPRKRGRKPNAEKQKARERLQTRTSPRNNVGKERKQSQKQEEEREKPVMVSSAVQITLPPYDPWPFPFSPYPLAEQYFEMARNSNMQGKPFVWKDNPDGSSSNHSLPDIDPYTLLGINDISPPNHSDTHCPQPLDMRRWVQYMNNPEDSLYPLSSGSKESVGAPAAPQSLRRSDSQITNISLSSMHAFSDLSSISNTDLDAPGRLSSSSDGKETLNVGLETSNTRQRSVILDGVSYTPMGSSTNLDNHSSFYSTPVHRPVSRSFQTPWGFILPPVCTSMSDGVIRPQGRRLYQPRRSSLPVSTIPPCIHNSLLARPCLEQPLDLRTVSSPDLSQEH